MPRLDDCTKCSNFSEVSAYDGSGAAPVHIVTCSRHRKSHVLDMSIRYNFSKQPIVFEKEALEDGCPAGQYLPKSIIGNVIKDYYPKVVKNDSVDKDDQRS